MYTAPAEGAPTVAQSRIRVIARRGIAGDRTLDLSAKGDNPDRGREITLIESEALEAARSEFGVDLSGGRNRRNLVTQGVRLESLLDKRFKVGSVELLGIRPCHPCKYLAGLTGTDAVRVLKGRGGLRCAVLTDGEIEVGARIEPIA
jgi:MOSC domain-containing protein YiiM